MKISTLTLLALILSFGVLGQNRNVGINTSSPDPSAVLHLESTDQGLLVPRLTVVQRDAIVAPAIGLIIYNTDDTQEEIYNGTCWVPSYLKNCTDCFSDISFTQASYTIDRVTNMSISIPTAINQSTSGGPIPMEFAITHTFSPETKVTLSQYSLTGSGNVIISIETTVFEPGGDYYISFFSTCGSFTTTKTVLVTINPCQQVVVNINQNNYNLVAQGVTGATCVVVTINEGVTIRSINATVPAFNTTGINPACNMGIINRGAVFGKGGNAPLTIVNGQNGSTAMVLVSPTEIRNSGMIYGGGGSGVTMGLFQSVNLGPFSLCFSIGAGGGGGMPNGVGANVTNPNCTITVGFSEPGENAGPNYDDNEGEGVSQTFNQAIALPPIQGNIGITANSGDGGDFAEPGELPTTPLDFSNTSLQICLNIPFIGNVCAPIPGFGALVNGIQNTVNAQFAAITGGQGGMAIQHSAPISMPDGNNQSYSIRGLIGN